MEKLDAGELLDRVLQHLRGAGVETLVHDDLNDQPQDGMRADAVVDLTWGGRTERFVVEARSGLRPATAAAVFQALHMSDHPLLVADRVAGGLADLARAQGVAYADASGNAWISTPSFLIDIQGRKADVTVADAGAATSFTKTDLRVILAAAAAQTLPEPPTLSARQLGALADVSHGAANSTMGKLRQLGHLTGQDLRRGAQLLDRWTDSYLARGGIHRTTRTVHVDPRTPLAALVHDSPTLSVGGEMAGEMLGWPIRPTSAIVYSPQLVDAARVLRGSSLGPGMPVEIRSPNPLPLKLASPVSAAMLARADMMMSADPRQIEVAQEVTARDENLRRLREIA